ncbi:hypothetical protein OHC51_08100 [Stenotrophomonas indicatrix]|uniref:hypothetical protein n=1 Tax=Stenotrophomonas indicatrix TaxID=2045451 RepID=UPI00300A86C5
MNWHRHLRISCGVSLMIPALTVAVALVSGPLGAHPALGVSAAYLEGRILSLLAGQGGKGWNGIPPQTVAQAIEVELVREGHSATAVKGGGETREGWFFWVYSEVRHGGHQTRLDTYVSDPANVCTFPVEPFARKLASIGLTGAPVRGLLPETWYLEGRSVNLAVRTYTSTVNGELRQCVETISIGPPEF